MLTIPAAAKELGLTRATLWKLAKSGKIPTQRAGKFMLITRSDLEVFRDIERKVGRPPKTS